jgi:hypothetical protein
MSSLNIDTGYGLGALNFINNANTTTVANASISGGVGGVGLNINSTTLSTNSSTGSIVLLNGGMSINSTSSQAIVISGGTSIATNAVLNSLKINSTSNNLLSLRALDGQNSFYTCGMLMSLNYPGNTAANAAYRSLRFITPMSTQDNNGLNPVGFLSNDRIDIRLNNNSKLYISSNYNIGIGSTWAADSSIPLTLYNTSGNSTELRISNRFINGNVRLGMPLTAGGILANSETSASILTNDFGPVQLITNASSGNPYSILINTAGNVGINTTTPNFTLDVSGGARITTGITSGALFATNSTITNIIYVNNSNTNLISSNMTISSSIVTNASSSTVIASNITTGNINFTGSLTIGGVPLGTGSWRSGTGGNLFYTSGNVGIGTTAPSFNLDITGTSGVFIRTTVTTPSIFVSTGNIVFPNNINSFGNMLFNTAGSNVTHYIKNINNRVRTSRANATAAVSTWTSRTSAADNSWYSVVWSAELSLFVAVAISGTGNRVMTSPDGITWTTRACPDNEWYGLAWSPELSLFVAVARTGTGNRVMTSPDGITWTTRAGAADNNWFSMTWSAELSLFVAVAVASIGSGDQVMTSPDGITWTTRTSAADNNWRRVTWSPELSLFVAVASSGIGNRVMTSPDGITWTTRASAADNSWYSVVWSAELSLFVAVAISGTGNRVMTSPDGITWTTRASAADNSWRSITWSPELSLFVAVAISGTVMTSPNGITWTTRASAPNQWYSVTWSTELSRFVAVSNSGTGNRVMTSVIALPNSDTFLVSPAHMTCNQQNGSITITGALSKGSGTFDISHPLDSSKRLVHSFIEGPRCDLIYRGTTQLENGTAIVNIDSNSVAQSDCAMTEGTFETLTINPVIKLQNHTSFDRVRGIISGNQLTILCENVYSSDTIHWYVMAERKDPFIKTWDRTNENGYLITERSNT